MPPRFFPCRWIFAWAALLALIVPLVAVLPAAAQSETGDPFAGALDERMPDLLRQYGVPGAVVAEVQDGAVTWTGAYGYADVAAKKPMTAGMVLEHGSNGKALTAWAVMRLVEQGKLALDAPANRYLKHWQIPSNQYDGNAVTVRQLLSHTSGFSIHGYVDYSPRRMNPPSLAETLDSPHLFEGLAELAETGHMSGGKAALVERPGSAFKYSGAGYTVLQMIIEDVSGEPFDTFMQRQVTEPLGLTSAAWAWTPALRANAPIPYGNEGQALEYRQLAVHGIGSEIMTTADFARFVAAAGTGLNGEPVGRGVLQPDTVRQMTEAQPGAIMAGYGLGYGVGSLNGARAINHSGANTGWTAFYIFDTERRTGFVVASNSSRGSPLHLALLDQWLGVTYGSQARPVRAPAPRFDAPALLALGLAGLLALALLIAVGLSVRQIINGRRARADRPQWRGLVAALPWLAWLLLNWYTVYSAFPVYLPAGFPDFWPSPAVLILQAVLAAWVVFQLLIARYPAARTQVLTERALSGA